MVNGLERQSRMDGYSVMLLRIIQTIVKKITTFMVL